MFTRNRYSIFFTVVFLYIVGSFIWWWWLLHSNNRENYLSLAEREEKAFIERGLSEQQFVESEFYRSLSSDYRRKTYMLIGEGIVFVTLITVGFLRIRSSFQSEIALTRQQNNFLLSITHELKSPLASLKLSMQTLQKRELPQQNVKRLADISLDDIDRLENLVENILLASKMEGSGFIAEKQDIDLSELVSKIYERVRVKFLDERGFTSVIESDIIIEGDRFIFSSALYNLIENAVKYSNAGDSIHVELIRKRGEIMLSVADTGIGISAEDKSRVFERFYRVGNEETRTTKGTGLGLYIVKQVVQFHNGTIKVYDNTPKGTRFEITLPETK